MQMLVRMLTDSFLLCLSCSAKSVIFHASLFGDGGGALEKRKSCFRLRSAAHTFAASIKNLIHRSQPFQLI